MTIHDQLMPILTELLRCGTPLEPILDQIERKTIGIALQNSRGNITRASKALGIHRNTLHNKLRTLIPERATAHRRHLEQTAEELRGALSRTEKKLRRGRQR